MIAKKFKVEKTEREREREKAESKDWRGERGRGL